ncbi:MAG: PAS domain S-box protein [Candidatus Thermoplasmatota archaeon]|nr:PAS domain S-box protein [Candidatus Thermoplasmatota archaeon]
MIDIVDTYLYLLFLSGIFAFILAYYAWHTFVIQQKMTPAKYFTFLLTCVGIWSFGSGLALWFTSTDLTYLCEQWKYLGIVFIPPTWLLLASSWTGRDSWVNWKSIVALYSIPLISLIIIFTDNFHHLFWQNIDYVFLASFVETSVVHGPAWWLFWGYAYVVIILGTMYLIRSAITLQNFYKKQAFLLLLGAVIPWIANAIYSLELLYSVFGSFDFTPISFAFTGLIYTYGFTHFKLIDVFPVSKETVFNNLKDPIVVFDTDKRIIELNNSAEKIFQLNASEIIGRKSHEVFTSFPEIFYAFNQSNIKHSFEIKLNKSNFTQYYDATLSKVIAGNQPNGYVLSLRDITSRKNATNALQESEEKFRTFTEAASIAIMIYQNDRWIYANPAAEKITGYSKKELLQMKFWEFTHPDFKDMIIQRGKLRQKGGNPPSHYEFKILTKQGIEKWVELNTKTILFIGKRAILVTASDITERKKSAKTINKQLTAIKSSVDGIGILNQKGEYEYLNDAHASIYGYDTPQDLIGKSWRTLYTEKELSRFDEEIMPTFQEHGRWRGEAVGKKKDGTTFNQEITLTGIEDGLICVVRDITKQKMMIKELEDAHELLYIINKDLKRKVKLRTQEVEQLMKQKDDFINQLGHDLKTPITPLMVLLPILKEKVKEKKDDELFEVIIRNVYFMKDLVNKTIDLAKLNTDKINFSMESIVLSDEIDAVMKNNQVLFEENNISVHSHVNSDLIVHGDKLRIQEVFNNLLTNAIKYTPEDGGVVTISAEDTGTDEITISVTDSGIGMSEEQLSQMFDEFYKADESRHNLDSSGLGLTITKKIIEKHGGHIWAESEGPGKGSTFYFTLKKEKNEKTMENMSSA